MPSATATAPAALPLPGWPTTAGISPAMYDAREARFVEVARRTLVAGESLTVWRSPEGVEPRIVHELSKLDDAYIVTTWRLSGAGAPKTEATKRIEREQALWLFRRFVRLGGELTPQALTAAAVDRAFLFPDLEGLEPTALPTDLRAV